MLYLYNSCHSQQKLIEFTIQGNPEKMHLHKIMLRIMLTTVAESNICELIYKNSTTISCKSILIRCYRHLYFTQFQINSWLLTHRSYIVKVKKTIPTLTLFTCGLNLIENFVTVFLSQSICPTSKSSVCSLTKNT